jgi:hypothetical protein
MEHKENIRKRAPGISSPVPEPRFKGLSFRPSLFIVGLAKIPGEAPSI